MKRLNAPFLSELEHLLANEGGKRRVLRSKLRVGSVLVPLMRIGEADCILFQRRAENMRNHASQISFPGGMRDGEEGSKETALRETREEIGLDESRIQVLGPLSDVYSKKGDVITPWLGYIGDFESEAHVNAACLLNPDEVKEIYCMRIDEFLDPNFSEDDLLRHGNRTVSARRYTRHKDKVIWGLSALILEDALKLFV